jgi:hypothetical protein
MYNPTFGKAIRRGHVVTVQGPVRACQGNKPSICAAGQISNGSLRFLGDVIYDFTRCRQFDTRQNIPLFRDVREASNVGGYRDMMEA